MSTNNEHAGSEAPLGAIENGRTYIERIEQEGYYRDGEIKIQEDADWQELRRCFETLADWAMRAAPAQQAEARPDGFEPAFLNCHLTAAEQHALWKESAPTPDRKHSAGADLTWQLGVFARKLIRAARKAGAPLPLAPSDAADADLLPCPFCNGAAHITFDAMGLATNAWAKCLSCGATVYAESGGKAGAVAEWNRRVAPQQATLPASGEHYDEVKATLQGVHRLCENISAIENRVGTLGSHARGFTHKITNALKHLDALATRAQPQADATACAHRIVDARNAAIASGFMCIDCGGLFAAAVPQPDAAQVLHPSTSNLVARFARALAEKLAAAEVKYGYTDGWLSPEWMDECRAKLLEHVAKGDPRDVAAYCAFLWHHQASTSTSIQDAAAPQPHPQLLKTLEKERDGWKEEVVRLRGDNDTLRSQIELRLAHQRSDLWYWQGNGTDHPDSFASAMCVVIRGEQLRDIVNNRSADKLHADVMRCRYPVDTRIKYLGYDWNTGRLDEVLQDFENDKPRTA